MELNAVKKLQKLSFSGEELTPIQTSCFKGATIFLRIFLINIVVVLKYFVFLPKILRNVSKFYR